MAQTPKIRRFRAWLLAQAADDVRALARRRDA
jgi:hypothetical protein